MKQHLINYVWTIFITALILLTGYITKELQGSQPAITAFIVVTFGFIAINVLQYAVVKIIEIYKNSLKQ